MRRWFLLLWLALAFESMPITASAGHWTISVHGGAAVPTGDFADPAQGDAQLGWQIGGSYDYHWTDTWVFGLDGGWNQNTHGAEGTVVDLGGGNRSTLERDRFSTWQFGAHTRFNLPTSSAWPVRWHVEAGGGLYGLTEDVTERRILGGVSSTRSRALTDKRAGFKFGMGGTWWTNPQVGIQAGLDYNIAFFDQDQATAATISYAAVRAGLTFRIPDTARLGDP